MNRPQTHTVQSAYNGRDGLPRVFVKGYALPPRPANDRGGLWDAVA